VVANVAGLLSYKPRLPRRGHAAVADEPQLLADCKFKHLMKLFLEHTLTIFQSPSFSPRTPGPSGSGIQ
jgi:hypothetical protein